MTKKNLSDIIGKLLKHVEVSDGMAYRDQVVSTVIDICAQGNYQFITDFEWYLQVLIQLTHVEGTRHGKLIASQLMDVAIRVKVIRGFAVKQLTLLLSASHLQSGLNEKNGVCEVLYAAAYIVGEYSADLKEHLSVIDAFLKPRVASLPGHIQAVFVHNTLKVYANLSAR